MHQLLPAPRVVESDEPFTIIKHRDARTFGVGESVLVDDNGSTNGS